MSMPKSRAPVASPRSPTDPGADDHSAVSLPTPAVSGLRFSGSNRFIPEYVRRAFHFSQMDFEYALSQMALLCWDPSRVYRQSFHHRKYTKNQWARDDPAFLVCLLGFLIIATIAYAIAFRVHAIGAMFALILNTLIVDFFGFGIICASLFWWIANSYLRRSSVPRNTQSKSRFFSGADIEWLYCFDIHCNAFFPFFMLLYVLQYFLLPVLLVDALYAKLISNTLYTLAFAAYFYVTFCGYLELEKENILKHTEMILYYPLTLICCLYVLSLIAPYVHATRIVMNFYFG